MGRQICCKADCR